MNLHLPLFKTISLWINILTRSEPMFKYVYTGLFHHQHHHHERDQGLGFKTFSFKAHSVPILSIFV